MPAPGNPQLSALWLGSASDRALAAERVRTALASSKTRREAARALGIGHRTLYDWLRSKPELRGVPPIREPFEPTAQKAQEEEVMP